MSKNKSYILQVGGNASVRLERQHEMCKTYTEDLLLKAGLSPGLNILEIGCGTGMVSTFIAKNIAPNGRLIAVDISREQLSIAKNNAAVESIKNIDFIQANIEDHMTDWHEQFDMIYCRFLLSHLENLQQASENLIHYLKPGGKLVCEEAINSMAFCEPSSAIFEQCIALLTKLTARNKMDFNGRKLYHHFKKLGLIVIEAKINQPLITTQFEKETVAMTIHELSPKLIESTLITQPELEKLLCDLDDLVNTEAVFHTPVAQVIGCKK